MRLPALGCASGVETRQRNPLVCLRENSAAEQTLLIRSDGRRCSPRCLPCHHLRPAVSAVVLGVVHGAIHAIRVPVNPERRVPDTTSDTEFIPRNDGGSIVTA